MTRRGEYDLKIKKQTWELFDQGVKRTIIADTLGLNLTVVSSWKTEYNKGKPYYTPRPITERMLETSSIKDHDEFKRIVLNNPDISMFKLAEQYSWNYNAVKRLVKKYQLR